MSFFTSVGIMYVNILSIGLTLSILTDLPPTVSQSAKLSPSLSKIDVLHLQLRLTPKSVSARVLKPTTNIQVQ